MLPWPQDRRRAITNTVLLVNKKAVAQLANAVTALHANNIDTLSEARVFCAVATATAEGAPIGITAISRLARLPISTVSRLLWEMSQRGLLEYTTDLNDRKKGVRANLDAFK